jgi:hypothetical protein
MACKRVVWLEMVRDGNEGACVKEALKPRAANFEDSDRRRRALLAESGAGVASSPPPLGLRHFITCIRTNQSNVAGTHHRSTG